MTCRFDNVANSQGCTSVFSGTSRSRDLSVRVLRSTTCSRPPLPPATTMPTGVPSLRTVVPTLGTLGSGGGVVGRASSRPPGSRATAGAVMDRDRARAVTSAPHRVRMVVLADCFIAVLALCRRKGTVRVAVRRAEPVEADGTAWSLFTGGEMTGGETNREVDR